MLKLLSFKSFSGLKVIKDRKSRLSKVACLYLFCLAMFSLAYRYYSISAATNIFSIKVAF